MFRDSLSDLFIRVNFESNSLILEKGWDLLLRGEGLWSREAHSLLYSAFISTLPRVSHLLTLHSDLNFLDLGGAGGGGH